MTVSSRVPEGEHPPVIVWMRRDLRLTDHEALDEAAKSRRPAIPVFLHDEVVVGYGAATKWRLGLGIDAFAKSLAGIGSRLTLLRGDALGRLQSLLAETGAAGVWWQRAHDPASRARDDKVEAALRAAGFEARSFSGHLLRDPGSVSTGGGGHYKVFTPYWKAVKDARVDPARPPPASLRPPAAWPASDRLDSWSMGAAMGRGASVVGRHVRVGEATALERLDRFLFERANVYGEARDFPGADGTSRLSEHLACGEISPRTIWHAAFRAMELGSAGAETFLKELAWRDFAYHLLHHEPFIETRNWRVSWDAFPWNEDEEAPEVLAWKRGRTGVPLVDAGMRELYVTGYMHNRARMVVASYLAKHLLTHWRIGLRWFEEHLTDWDPASNAMGWQWSAGSGPDAAPYFRVFNPDTQLDKFDPDRVYANRWIAEGRETPSPDALSFFDAIPKRWGMSPEAPYPPAVVDARSGRERALSAYRETFRK